MGMMARWGIHRYIVMCTLQLHFIVAKRTPKKLCMHNSHQRLYSTYTPGQSSPYHICGNATNHLLGEGVLYCLIGLEPRSKLDGFGLCTYTWIQVLLCYACTGAQLTMLHPQPRTPSKRTHLLCRYYVLPSPISESRLATSRHACALPSCIN